MYRNCTGRGLSFWGQFVNAVLIVALLFMMMVFCYHGFYFYRFMIWLKDPKANIPPKAQGIWKHVFDMFQQQFSHQFTHQAKTHKKDEDKQQRTIEYLNHIISALPSGAMIVDSQGRIKWKNRLANEYFGLPVELGKKDTLKTLINHLEFHQFLDTAHGERKDTTQGKISIDKKPTPLTLWLTAVPFEAQTSLLIAHDISAAEQLNITRSAFVANVSHELKTPLTTINGFLETLQDTPDLDADTRNYFIGLMQKEGERMLNLIADLLTLSRLENQSYQRITFEAIDLSHLVISVLQDSKHLAQHHQLTAQIADDVWVMGIYQDLYSAFSNLILNALNHTPKGTHIDVSLQKKEHTAHFMVKDTGDGICPEHLGHITERFYRVDKGRSRKTGGSGLGLAIVKHALATHGATLDIDSTVGVGSCFATQLTLTDTPNCHLP